MLYWTPIVKRFISTPVAKLNPASKGRKSLEELLPMYRELRFSLQLFSFCSASILHGYSPIGQQQYRGQLST